MENYKDIYHAFSGSGSDEDVYTVSTNRKLYVTDIVATNKETSTVLIIIKDDTDTKVEINVSANDTKVVKLSSPISFIDSVKAQVSAYTNGSSITLVGYEL